MNADAAHRGTPSELFSLDGRVFVVTGASSGIGRAMAGFLAMAGARIVALARRADALTALADEISGHGGECKTLCADLSKRDAIAGYARECIHAFERVDGVVNAAGVNLRQGVEDITAESWDQTLGLNLAAPFFLSRELVPEMKKRNYGRIINIASLQSSRAFENGLAYGASKGGVCQLTRAMAEAWSRHGITCNAIAPGFFPTELTEPVFSDPARAEQIANQTARGRNGELRDLAGATIFFASPASEYITGQTLYVDGGYTAK